MIDFGHKESCPFEICKNTETVFNEARKNTLTMKRAIRKRTGQEHADFKGLINRHRGCLGHAILRVG